MAKTPGRRPHPSVELLEALREGKAALRRHREGLNLTEKVRVLLELQRVCYPLLSRHRQLAEWERPWAITP